MTTKASKALKEIDKKLKGKSTKSLMEIQAMLNDAIEDCCKRLETPIKKN